MKREIGKSECEGVTHGAEVVDCSSCIRGREHSWLPYSSRVVVVRGCGRCTKRWDLLAPGELRSAATKRRRRQFRIKDLRSSLLPATSTSLESMAQETPWSTCTHSASLSIVPCPDSTFPKHLSARHQSSLNLRLSSTSTLGRHLRHRV